MPPAPPEGAKNAKIALIGEGLGQRELEQGRAFVGPTGNLLWATLKKFSVSRGDCFIINVIPDRVVQNPLSTLSESQLKDYISNFIREIQQTQCNVYVPMGNLALLAMTGNRDISLWRNSILSSPINGRKTIPTYHPAAALRDTSLYDLILNDFKRIVEESVSPLLDLPKPELITKPTLKQALEFLRRIKDEAKPFAFDVETPGGVVTCISFANDNDRAISINLIDKFWGRDEFAVVYGAIKDLLECPTIEKGGHNVAYDIIALRQHAIAVAPPYFDTMHKHHALDPIAQKHSLAFLCSILTRQPFYKEWDVVEDTNIQDLETYNAVDSLRTIESNQQLDNLLAKRVLFYKNHYQNLLPHLIEMYDTGLLVDSQKRQQLANATKQEVKEKETAIAQKLSLPAFNSNSPKQCAEVVYDILKCKPRYKLRNKRSGARTLSTDEETLLLLYQQEPISILTDIIAAREKRKLLSFLEPTSKAAMAKRRGNVIRTEYKPMTKTGRLMSSASTATKVGLNLQNQPKAVRGIFIPRPNHIFIELDLSQAEARVTTWDAGNFTMMDYFEKSKTETHLPKEEKQYDIHRWNASLSLGIQYDEVTYEGREACKRVVHGTNYGMEAKRQQLTLLKELKTKAGEPYWLPLPEVERRRQRYLDSDPSVLFRQERIRQEVLKTRRQINPYGRIITFHEIINDRDVLFYFGQRDYSEVFRIAYAYIPQSTVADCVNLALIDVNNELHKQKIGRVAAQVHDSLLLEVRDYFEAVYSATRYAKQMLEREVMIRGNLLSIPVDIKIGYDWSMPHEVASLEQLEEVYNETRKGS